jgi:hypothetical protein
MASDHVGHMHFRRMGEGSDADFAVLARAREEKIGKLPDLYTTSNRTPHTVFHKMCRLGWLHSAEPN